MSPEDTTPETSDPSPEPVAGSPRRRSGILGGALLGAVALTASIVGVSAIASAQDDSEIEPADEADVEASSDDAAWQPFEDCIDAQLGDLESSLFGDLDEDEFDETSISDEDFAALEAAWEAADEACGDLLPEDVKAAAEAFDAFDRCLTDAGVSDDTGAVVHVEDGEGGQSIQFGENAGTVTITGDANGVSVATDGDVSIIDDEAFETALEGCEELLPEGFDEFDEFDMDEDEIDEFDMDEDEFDLDEDDDEEGDDDA